MERGFLYGDVNRGWEAQLGWAGGSSLLGDKYGSRNRWGGVEFLSLGMSFGECIIVSCQLLV